MTRENRLWRLNRSWGFACSCSQCTQGVAHAAASDARIEQIASLRRQLRGEDDDHDHDDHDNDAAAAAAAAATVTPHMAELLVSLMDQERLWAVRYEAYAHAALAWSAAGDRWRATMYARLAEQHGLAAVGPADPDVVAMRRLAASPADHWSWLRPVPSRRRTARPADDEDEDERRPRG